MERVLFVINDLRSGGAERVFATDAAALAGLGHEVTIALLYGSHEDAFAHELPASVQVVELGASGTFDWRATLGLRSLIRKLRAKVVVSTLNDANLLTRTALMGMRGTRYLRREANELSMKPWWHRLLDTVFDWRTDGVIALSEHMAAGIRRSNLWMRSVVHVLPNAVPIPAVAADPAREPVRIVTIGSLTPKKDHATLLRACSELVRRGVDFSLMIIGEGRERARLSEMIATRDLEAVVTLRGQLPNDEALHELQQASLFVLTSHVEGSPNVLLEAMAAGLPGAISDLPSTREVADDSCALFAPAGNAVAFAEAIERLCADPDLRTRMGAHARHVIVRHFSPESRLTRLRKLLSSE